MQPSVLIVDDEPHVLLLLTKILEPAGYCCQTAESVQSARQALKEQTFDLVLTDINMPEESGSDLARYINVHHPQTGVVMVTGIDDPDQAKEVLAIGVYGYIIKPFTQNLVLITIENALRRLLLEQEVNANIHILEVTVAERTHSLNEQLYLMQNLIDAIPAPLFYKGLDGRYIGCNRAFATTVGLPRTSIIGKTVQDIHPPRVAERLWQKDQELLWQGGSQVYEQALPAPDGVLRIGMLHKATFEDIEGNVAGLIGVRLDITEIKQIERALRQSEEKLRSIMDNLQIGVMMINPQMEILEINRQVQQWFPQDQEARGCLCYQVLVDRHEQQPCKICPSREVFTTGMAAEATYTRQTAQGERIFRVLASPMHNHKGAVVAALELIEDVTDALAAERELRQAQKLEAVGALAAGIAHEINTPVQYIGDNIHFLDDAYKDLLGIQLQYEVLLRTIKEKGPLEELAGAIEAAVEAVDMPFLAEEIPKTILQSLDGVNRVGKIVKAMREFSHPGTGEKTYVDVNRALESTLTISRNEWKYVADVETDLAPDLPLLLCLPGEINQVFLNIIVNASHAISDVTDAGNNGKGLIRLTTRAQNGKMEIRISDSGGGIPEAVGHRIFDPFFTTKTVGKGTGQGLAIARSVVVDKHQGAIRFETEVGRGTTFILELPIIEAASTCSFSSP
jgi:PAS domain S-box-containing protein